jgi:hypothetical protein
MPPIPRVAVMVAVAPDAAVAEAVAAALHAAATEAVGLAAPAFFPSRVITLRLFVFLVIALRRLRYHEHAIERRCVH